MIPDYLFARYPYDYFDRRMYCSKERLRNRRHMDNIVLFMSLLAHFILHSKDKKKKESKKLYEYICSKHCNRIGEYATRIEISKKQLRGKKKLRKECNDKE